MEGKTSFLLYCDLMPMVSKMPDEEAGKLFKLIFEYTNDLNPDESKYGILVEVAFAQIKGILKKDLEKWKGTIKKNSDNGKKSAEARKNKPATVDQNQRPLTTLPHPSTNPSDKDKENVYTSYIERLCSAFGVREGKNQRSFFAATYFVEALAKDGRLDYLSSQLEGYISLREQRYRGSIDKFMGTPEDNYNNGVWCKETYSIAEKDELTPEQKRIKSAYGFVPTIAK